jgi:hypothetical protein
MRNFASHGFVVIAAGLCLFTATAPYTFLSKEVLAETEGKTWYLKWGPGSAKLMGDLPVDAFMKELRQGSNVISSEIDVCHSVSKLSPRKDRFVVRLNINGDNLSGSGVSQEDKVPATVSLTRQTLREQVTDFRGFITRGPMIFEVKTEWSFGVQELTEEQFQSAQAGAIPVIKPDDFHDSSPGSLAIQIKRGGLVGLMKALKTQNVKVYPDTLAEDCSLLRSGKNIVRIETSPARASLILKKIRLIPGVVSAGWTRGSYAIQDAVLISAGGWQDKKGNIERDKLTSAVAASITKSLSGTLQSYKLDDTSNELTVIVRRRNGWISRPHLTDMVKVTMILGPEESAASSDKGFIIWIGKVLVDTIDEAPSRQLKLMNNHGNDAKGTERNSLASAIASDLNGRIWIEGWTDPK